MFSLLVNNHKFNIFVLWDGIYILFFEEHIQIEETFLFLVENMYSDFSVDTDFGSVCK